MPLSGNCLLYVTQHLPRYTVLQMLILQIFNSSCSHFSFDRYDNMNFLVFIAFINLILASLVLGAEPALTSLHPTLSFVAAAQASVTSNTSYAPPLFRGETIQLTEQALVAAAAEIQNVTISGLFSFGAPVNNTTASSGRPHSCKVLPGDSSWPGYYTWRAFNSVLGGSLITTVPLAAFCYANWPSYDVGICAVVTNQWLNSSLQ